MTETARTQPPFYARWSDDRLKPQPLREHLVGIARCGEKLAEALRKTDATFIAAAKLVGLLHDLGKYRPEFQRYLDARDRSQRSTETDHTVYGAAAADEVAIAFAVAGHHAGLHDCAALNNALVGEKEKYQAQKRFPKLLEVANSPGELNGNIGSMLTVPDDGVRTARLEFDEDIPSDMRRFEVFVWMLFSVLVDADRLDSEKFE